MPDQATDRSENTTQPQSNGNDTGEQAAIEQESGHNAEDALQQELEAARKKAEENWELALRAKADLENLRKRSQRDIENAHKYALERMAGELLSVRDSMELGLGASLEGTDIESLKEGVALTLKMLIQVMEKFGITEINPEQEKFNPELHQAMAMQESDKLEPNTVVAVMQKGYALNDRLLRPALVTVAKAPKPEDYA